MKVQYFYDGQFRRVLKHLIRLFGEFQVQNGVDANNKPKYKKVPCLYTDFSRSSQYLINFGSENVMKSAPFMSISVASLTIDRKSTTAPVGLSTTVGKNIQNDDNSYTDKLEQIQTVHRWNPTPFKLKFDLNIWTTTTTNKLELFEQIATLFNPAIELQTSMNPLDWTSLSQVLLTDCIFSTKSSPEGSDPDLDIMKLTFETIIWLSLPALIEKNKIITQIISNIKSYDDDYDFLLRNPKDIQTLIYTPSNYGIKPKLISNNYGLETYEVQLLTSFGTEETAAGAALSWREYFEYLYPENAVQNLSLQFLSKIEDSYPIRANVISIGNGDNENKLIVNVDTSSYDIVYTVKRFVKDDNTLITAKNDDIFINISIVPFNIGDVVIKPNDIFKLNNGIWEVLNTITEKQVIYNEDDSQFYRLDPNFGWIGTILQKYNAGFWKIGYKE